MEDNVAILPRWKHNSTTEEWFQEYAMMARVNPERFARVIVITEEDLANGNTATRWNVRGITSLTLAVGILQVAICEIYERMRGRR